MNAKSIKGASDGDIGAGTIAIEHYKQERLGEIALGLKR